MSILKNVLAGLLAILVTVLFYACRKEMVIEVSADFSFKIDETVNRFPKAVAFTNNSTGADNYKWEFENGDPASSTEKNPGLVYFATPGSYKVKLEAWNQDRKMVKEIIVKVDSILKVGFDTTVLVNSFAPVTVKLTNNCEGATSYKWTFTGATPATSLLKNPANIVFSNPGTYTMSLLASNGKDSLLVSKQITVAARLSAAFDIVPSFEDEDYEAPLTATLQNNSTSGSNWLWTSTGGVISNSTAKNSTIFFSAAGSYTVTLRADNNKDTQVVVKTIVVKPNSNLRTHSNIKFGIAAAHGSVGSFYSTKLRKSFVQSDNLDTSGKWIDISFFGVNSTFSFNKFIAPDSAQDYAFSLIPQARKTVFINNLAECGCGLNVSATDFDNMVTDNFLQPLTINGNMAGWHEFNSATVPRIILFKTEDGRKGAIKIKQFVQNGNSSYLLTDIKIQKN